MGPLGYRENKYFFDNLGRIKKNPNVPFSLYHTYNPTYMLPPKFCYNLSNSVRLEMRPMYTEDLCSKRQFLRFIDKFKIVHINMSLTTKRAKLTISKSGIIWCIYLATSLTDYCTQGHFRIMLHEVTWQVRDSFYHIKNCSILSLSRETNKDSWIQC